MSKAKEAEANGTVISIVSVKGVGEKMDLPPAYDDVTKMTVSLAPLHVDIKEDTKKDEEEEEDNRESKA